MTPTPKGLISLTALAAIALPCAASAQSYGSGGAAQFQAGYGGARYTTARPVTGSTLQLFQQFRRGRHGL